MHILIIPSWYKTPNQPNSGTFFEEQARMFHKRGHKVAILYPHHNLRFLGNSRYKIETPEDYVDNGIPTYYSFTESMVPKVEKPTLLDVKTTLSMAYKKYKSYKKKHGKPDVIHAHSILWGGVVANYISSKENIPYYLTEHFTGWILNEKYNRENSYKKLLLKVINNSSSSFAVSLYLKNELVKRFSISKSKIVVLPNIVNDIFYYRSSLKASNSFRMVIVGNLIERKNHLTLFKAIKILNDSHTVNLLVIGEGEIEADLKSFVLENELTKEIQFFGALNRQEVVEVLLTSHAVFSASIMETFGVNIVEGLAIGRPVIAYDSGGPRDIIRKEDGILINENSPEAFVQAVIYLIKNYNNFNQEEISKSCIERFGEEAIYKNLMNRYKSEVLKKKYLPEVEII